MTKVFKSKYDTLGLIIGILIGVGAIIIGSIKGFFNWQSILLIHSKSYCFVSLFLLYKPRLYFYYKK